MRRSITAWMCFAAAALGAAGAWAQQRMEILPLHHRTLEQVLPALRPLLEPGGVQSSGIVSGRRGIWLKVEEIGP
jgi:hypothetical protein